FPNLSVDTYIHKPLLSGWSDLPALAPFVRKSHAVQRDSAIVTEAYRTLHTTIMLPRAGEPPKSIVFTSSTQDEGKTISVLNTAVAFSQMGTRVLVIDADLRHPSCHRVLGRKNVIGLTEILTGQTALDETIQFLDSPSFFFLGSGQRAPNPVGLLRSSKMHETLVSLTERFDHILIDSPPVIPATDALLLSTMTDGVVLVINSQKTPLRMVKEARARLSYARANVLGVLLNRVNVRHGHYAYYYGGNSFYGDKEQSSVAE